MFTFLGPFFQALYPESAVDFTRHVARGDWAIVLPLETGSNKWYIIDPFQYNVWLLLFISIPTMLLTMGLADYIYVGIADWNNLSGFVIRNVLSEQTGRFPNLTRLYQKILSITWLWCALLLVQSYAGNLTAMRVKPTFQAPIRTLKELLSQDEISLVIEEGSTSEFYASTAASGTVVNKLYERSTRMPPLTPQERVTYGCYVAKLRDRGRFGSFCETARLWTLISDDFSKSGKCNFYPINEKVITSMIYAMAFQVGDSCIKSDLFFWSFVFFRKEVLFWRISIFLLTFSIRWDWNSQKVE